MKVVSTKSAAILTLGAMLLGSAAVAHADRATELNGSTPEIVVSFKDLDITRQHGINELYSRIQRAAKSVCDYDRLRKELARQRRSAACYRAAVDDAIQQINHPKLTALHRAKSRPLLG